MHPVDVHSATFDVLCCLAHDLVKEVPGPFHVPASPRLASVPSSQPTRSFRVDRPTTMAARNVIEPACATRSTGHTTTPRVGFSSVVPR
jgi:hypothetical protein